MRSSDSFSFLLWDGKRSEHLANSKWCTFKRLFIGRICQWMSDSLGQLLTELRKLCEVGKLQLTSRTFEEALGRNTRWREYAGCLDNSKKIMMFLCHSAGSIYPLPLKFNMNAHCLQHGISQRSMLGFHCCTSILHLCTWLLFGFLLFLARSFEALHHSTRGNEPPRQRSFLPWYDLPLLSLCIATVWNSICGPVNDNTVNKGPVCMSYSYNFICHPFLYPQEVTTEGFECWFSEWTDEVFWLEHERNLKRPAKAIIHTLSSQIISMPTQCLKLKPWPAVDLRWGPQLEDKARTCNSMSINLKTLLASPTRAFYIYCNRPVACHFLWLWQRYSKWNMSKLSDI